MVEEQHTAGLPLRGAECDEVAAVEVVLLESAEVDLRQYVDVVDEYGFVEGEERCGVSECAAGVEELLAFVADEHGAGPLVAADVVDEHIAEVVYVDDAECGAGVGESLDVDLEQCFAVDFDEGLWAVVGEGFEPCAESGGEDEGLHFLKLKINN